MDVDVPYMPSVKNLQAMLNAIQKAAVPDAFGIDFLKDLGFTSSNDRSIIKVFKYLGLLDASGRPQAAYRELVNEKKTREVLAERLRVAYDDLFQSDREAYTKPATDLKGWFKTKTGVSEPVAEKMATTFKTLASYADFSAAPSPVATREPEKQQDDNRSSGGKPPVLSESSFGLTYRIEIHLPDTTNVDTFRSIFRALREELLS